MPILLHPPGFRLAFAEKARGEFGEIETGENSGDAVRKYQAATWLAPDSWRWCAAFVCWIYQQTAAELCPGLLPTRPTSPRAYDFESWGAAHARLIRVPHEVRTGDILIYKFSHVGIACQPKDAFGVFSVEGNTAPPGGGRDGVYGRYRSLSSIRSIVRLYESTTPQT